MLPNLAVDVPSVQPRVKVRLTHEGERESYSGVHVSARDAAGDDGAEGHSDAPTPIDREEFTEERVSVELTGEGDLRRGAIYISVHVLCLVQALGTGSANFTKPWQRVYDMPRTAGNFVNNG